MSQRVEISPIGLLNRYHCDFPRSIIFSTSEGKDTIEGLSSLKFTNSRVKLLDNYILERKPQTEFSQALLAEELVGIAIKKPLKERGFFLHLAPQNLESGKNQKGVDLLITDSNNMICLGIDLKLRKGRSNFNRDGFGWASNLQSPYIYLTMGNWSLKTRQEPHVGIRKWINDYTCPKLITSGKIPNIYELRQYVIPRIERSISGYIETLKEPNINFVEATTPKSREEVDILEYKLFILSLLFCSLVDQCSQKINK